MTCVYKEYKVKIKMVQEQWVQLKVKFVLGHNIEAVIKDTMKAIYVFAIYCSRLRLWVGYYTYFKTTHVFF